MNDNIKLGPGMALAALKKMFNEKEIKELYTGKRIGTIDIEITDLCNFKCLYCYAESSPYGNERTASEKRLTMDEIMLILDQASDMDIRLFNIQGGEPMVDKEKFFEVAEYALPRFNSLVAFTNASLITAKDAARIKAMDMALCVKLDTLNQWHYQELTQTKTSIDKIMEAMDILETFGVTVSTNSVATPVNYYDIPWVWRYVADKGFTPFVARNHYHGRTRDNPDLQLTAEELGNLFKELQRIDKEEYGIKWPNDTIWPRGNSCQRYRAGVYVNHFGEVLPCSEADPEFFSLGNIRNEPLSRILDQERILPFRNIYDKLHGACATDTCDYAKQQQCYGCRVSAADIGLFRGKELHEEFFGGDALCVHNKLNPLTAKELKREPLKPDFG